MNKKKRRYQNGAKTVSTPEAKDSIWTFKGSFPGIYSIYVLKCWHHISCCILHNCWWVLMDIFFCCFFMGLWKGKFLWMMGMWYFLRIVYIFFCCCVHFTWRYIFNIIKAVFQENFKVLRIVLNFRLSFQVHFYLKKLRRCHMSNFRNKQTQTELMLQWNYGKFHAALKVHSIELVMKQRKFHIVWCVLSAH